MHGMSEYLMVMHELEKIRRANETRKQHRARILANECPALEGQGDPSTNPKETARCR